MRKVMVLTAPDDLKEAREVASELEKLYFEVSMPDPEDQESLEEVEQADLFVLVARGSGRLKGLARTLARDQLLSAIPRLVITEEQALNNFDYCRLADEVLLLPLRRKEMAARVRMLLWRTEKVDPSNEIVAGELNINLMTYEVTMGGELVELTFKEYELLRYLVTHSRRVHSRRELLSRVWGEDYYGGERTVDVHIRRIRSKLETGNKLYIQTVRGVGYRFVG